MVWKEMLILSVLVLVFNVGRINNFLALLLLVMLTVIDYIMDYIIYKKLFYTSIYGDTAPTYMSMPVSAGQMIRGKTGVVLMMSAVIYVLTVAGGCIAQNFHQYSEFFGAKEYIMSVFGIKEWSVLPAILGFTAKLLRNVSGTLFFAIMVFCLIVWYQSFPAEKRRGFFRTVPWLIGLAVGFITGRVIGLVAGIAGAVILSDIIYVALYTALSALIYRYLVHLLENKYEIV